MSNTPNRPDLDALGKLCDAATPGPWSNGHDPSHFDTSEVSDNKTFAYYVPDENNARFIAAARTALPALIAYARKIEGERDEAVWSRDLWQEDCRLQYENRDYWRTRTETAEAECERLRGLLGELWLIARDNVSTASDTAAIQRIRAEGGLP